GLEVPEVFAVPRLATAARTFGASPLFTAASAAVCSSGGVLARASRSTPLSAISGICRICSRISGAIFLARCTARSIERLESPVFGQVEEVKVRCQCFVFSHFTIVCAALYWLIGN